MERPTKVMSLVGSGCAALATLYGGATVTHDKLQQIDSMQESLILIDMRLESKILNDRYAVLDQRIQDIEIRYGLDLFEAPGPVREQYRIMLKERDALEHEINAVQQEYKREGSEGHQYYERKLEKRSH